MGAFKVIDHQGAAALVARVAAFDPAAEEQLYNRYRPGVTVILSHALGGQPAVADLTQETFRIVFQKITNGEIREPEKLSAFIWSVAHNVAIDYFRKRKTARLLDVQEAADLADKSASPLDHLLQEEEAQAARYIIGKMGSSRDREILFRFYLDEEDKEQICADLGLSSLQFNLVLFRARKQYKKIHKKLNATRRISAGGSRE